MRCVNQFFRSFSSYYTHAESHYISHYIRPLHLNHKQLLKDRKILKIYKRDATLLEIYPKFL